MNKYQLIVFDWDGTLMDSASKIVSCMAAAIDKVGLPSRTEEQMRHIIGLGMVEAIQYLYPGEDIDIHALAAKYRDEFMQIDAAPSPLYPNVNGMLDKLEKQGYWLAVATGKSRIGLNHVLKEVGLETRFHATRTADETTSKPHPMMLQELMAECGYAPEQTLMIGDTEFDIEMAHAAGVDVVAVKGGAHPEEHLKKFNPLVILDCVSDLVNWLEN